MAQRDTNPAERHKGAVYRDPHPLPTGTRHESPAGKGGAPVLGLTQSGVQLVADRYTYLPHVGLFAALVFGAREAAQLHPILRVAFLGAFAAGTVALASVAHGQTRVWRDSVTLFEHASRVTPGNPIIENHYGAALQRLGRHEEAIRHYRRALRFDATNARTHSNLGRALQHTGRNQEAILHFREALVIHPTYVHALTNLGIAMAVEGQRTEAEALFRRAHEIEPEAVGPVANLAQLLFDMGRFEEAAAAFEEVLELEPHHPTAKREWEEAMKRGGASR